MISCPSITSRVISGHYDLSTLFYRILWGPHIHHGLWEGNESPAQAQVALTERLADLAKIREGESLIDVGCGMGGSSIHLAKTRKIQGTGVTISRVQRMWAGTSAMLQGVGSRVSYRCQDAERLEIAPSSLDVVWSVECTEHLFDKGAFFKKAASWLKPGGRMAICAWLAGNDPLTESQKQQVYDVCEGFFCPSLGTFEDYRGWMTEGGLQMQVVEDWTDKVAKTWKICQQRVERFGIPRIAKLVDKNSVLFLDRFETLYQAYMSGAMRYGCFVASKPS